MNAAVLIKNLDYAYPDGTKALNDVNLKVAEGEKIAIIGANGAGKSTLLLHLNGILQGDGVVEVLGTPVVDNHFREIRQRVGIVFQDPDDQLFMTTVAQDVAFGPTNQGLPTAEIAERVHDALTAVGMNGHGHRTAHHLSFGQKKRVATATVLSMQPDVLVLDEPSSNLDPRARRQLMEILQSLDVTTIVVTHDLPYAYELCDRAVIMSDGKIVADGPIGKILSDEELLLTNGLELPHGFFPVVGGKKERR